MDWLDLLTPKFELWGLTSYWFIWCVAFLESLAFVGLAVPGTTIIVAVGFLASQHLVDVGDVIWIVALGGIIGDTISYFIGMRGLYFFSPTAKIFKTEYVERGKKFFEKHGARSVLIARFIGPLRPIIPFIAGLVHMPFRKFFLLNVVGSFASSFVFVLFGFFFGKSWPRIEHALGRHSGVIFLTMLLLAVGYFFRRRYLWSKR